MEVVAVIVSIAVVLGICLAFLLPTSPQCAKNETSPQALTAVDFIPNQMYQENATGRGIAINEETKTFCLLKSVDSCPRLLPFSGLLGSVLLINGIIIEKRMRNGSKKFMATVKELEHKLQSSLFGECEPTSQRNSEQKIDLAVLLNTKEEPIYIVNFLDMDAKKGGLIYEKALNSAQHWHSILSDLIDQASGMEFSDNSTTEQAQEFSTNNTTDGTSVTEELTKLSVLLDKQLITQEEFDTQKEKLFAGK